MTLTILLPYCNTRVLGPIISPRLFILTNFSVLWVISPTNFPSFCLTQHQWELNTGFWDLHSDSGFPCKWPFYPVDLNKTQWSPMTSTTWPAPKANHGLASFSTDKLLSGPLRKSMRSSDLVGPYIRGKQDWTTSLRAWHPSLRHSRNSSSGAN